MHFPPCIDTGAMKPYALSSLLGHWCYVAICTFLPAWTLVLCSHMPFLLAWTLVLCSHMPFPPCLDTGAMKPCTISSLLGHWCYEAICPFLPAWTLVLCSHMPFLLAWTLVLCSHMPFLLAWTLVLCSHMPFPPCLDTGAMKPCTISSLLRHWCYEAMYHFLSA